MDELDNDALPLLLILDDELFPQLLEWSASKGWSDLVIFLLETDYLRFKTNDLFESDYDSLTLYEPFHLIEKNNDGCFNKFCQPEKVEALKRLLNSGIPLKSVYSQVCSAVWKEMLDRGNQIIYSRFWPSVRRCIVQHHEIAIEDMLCDDSKRQYFDRYIQHDASDLASLQCLLSLRRILKALDRYKVGPDTPEKRTLVSSNSNLAAATHSIGTSSPNTGLDMFSYLLGRSKDESGPSMMNRWRASKNAVVSASKALQAPFAGHHHSHAAPGGIAAQPPQHDYTDPFEAFKILLEGTRQLQKQFFPTSANLTSGTTTAFTTLGTVANNTNGFLYGGSHRRGSNAAYACSSSDAGDSSSAASSPRARSNSGSSPRASNNQPPPVHPHHHHGHHMHPHRNCSGISEALRIEIQSTLTINSSVRAREIETVDRAFAFACAHMLEKLLKALEQEMLTYISAIFTEFQETNDYALMVAHARALKCKRVSDYVCKLEFLYDRVRQQRIVSWKDTQTRGKVFIAYEQLNVEGDDQSVEEAKEAGPPGTTGPVGNASARRVSPNGGFGTGASSPSKGSQYASTKSGAQTSISGTYQSDMFEESPDLVPFKANVVAISLEIVLPHTTILSPATVASCPHRVSLYAGGRRRAARLKQKLVAASFIDASRVSSSPALLKGGLSAATTATPSPVESAVSAPTSPAISSPSKSPMRRLSSVKFHFDEPRPVVPAEVSQEQQQSSPEDKEAEPETLMARSHSLDSEHDHGDEDTLSELPSVGIAGSITRRNIQSIGDVGMNGSDCFDDIVNANNNSGVFSNCSGKQLIDGYVEDQADDSSDSRSDGSDSSSDYDGDVRQVYSNADLDSLMMRTNSDALEQDEPLTPRSGKFNARNASIRLMSRTASNASCITNATGASVVTAGVGSAGGAYDDGIRKLVAIDTTKLDRTLYRDVLGSAQTLSRADSAERQASAAANASKPGVPAAKRISTKQLAASLAVALAGALCSDEQFGKKFASPVEESFTFTTDMRGLELLNDLLYSKQAAWLGRDQMESYAQAFEKVTSVFRQNSMLDTSRPVYRVCVHAQSSVIKAADAARIKQQMVAVSQAEAARAASSRSGEVPPKAPLHPVHHHTSHGPASRIAHSHIRIGISYTLLTPAHSMLNTLHSVAAAACSALSSGQNEKGFVDSRDLSCDAEAKGDADAQHNMCPLPIKLRYQDYFSEYSSVLRSFAPSSGTHSLQESLYELYLGTEPSLGAPPKQQHRLDPTSLDTKSLCEPITRHVGLCDFSMSEVVASLSHRLTLQVLMLVLVDRPVMLLSASSTLLSKVQAMIPRLIWPFRTEKTHVVRQILNGAELHRFVYRHDVPFVSETQQPVIREKKLNRKTSSWREMITRFTTTMSSTLSTSSHKEAESLHLSSSALPRSPRPSVPRQRKSGSSSDLLAGILRRTSSGAALSGSPQPPGSEDGDLKSGTSSPVNLGNLSIDIPGRSGGESPQRGERSPFSRIVTPPSLLLPGPSSKPGKAESCSGDAEDNEVQVDQHSCILGVDSNAFYAATPELRDELENLRIRGSAFTIIDIDSGIILNRRPDDFDEEGGESPPKPLPSRLSDPEIFKCANFGIFRSLLKSVTLVNEDLQAFTKAQFKPIVVDDFSEEIVAPDAQVIASRIAEKIVMSNREIEKAFYAFWSELVLRALPKSIQHYPGPKVISCDIRAMLTELLHTVVASSASMDMGEDVEDLQLAAGTFADSRQGSTRSLGSGGSEISEGPWGLQSHHNGYSSKALSCASKQLPAVTPNSQMFDNMNKMPFEEFLAMFVEQVANHGETNMCYAFYKEFIADGSVVFKDLLTRHSAVLDRWSM